MAARLGGLHVLVTGGGRGIGRAIALAAAREGADVTVAARTAGEIEAVAGEIRALGRRAAAVVGDVASEEGAESIVTGALAAIGPLDVLVNNAGTFFHGEVADMAVADWDRVIATNLRGPFLVTRAALASLIARRSGAVVFVSSTSGKRGDAGAAAYCASKHGLMGLASSLVHELRRHDIRVIVVSPSAVDTSPEAGAGRRDGRGARLTADDVAEAVVAALALPGRTLVREIELWATNP